MESIKNKTRLHAEIWDQVQYLCNEDEWYNDHQLHAVIYFQDLLDKECLRKAVLLSMEIVPILGSRFVVNPFRPHWERGQYEAKDVITYIECSNPETEIERFLTGLTNEYTGPQLRVGIIRSSNKDSLCILMNHMVCDGTGFKEYLYLLSRIYSELQCGTFNINTYHTGSRSSKQIYRHLKLGDRFKIFWLPNQPPKNNIFVPLSKGKCERRPFILKSKLHQERFNSLKEFGQKHSVTINDLIMAAYYRALYKILDINRNESLIIPCMVDLRRYLPNRKVEGICNLASMIICNIGPEIGTNFEETVRKVSREMDARKRQYPGMHGLSTLNGLFRLLPFAAAAKIFKKNSVNPAIAITNIGVIDSSRLLFGKIPIEDAFITSSIKYPPYFQLALTTYNNAITFSVNLYGTEDDRKFIQNFFLILDKELGFYNKMV
jgi:NRPS condensation-like uncharacterized protein